MFVSHIEVSETWIDMQKNGYYFSRAHRSHYLESLQAIAYSNTEYEFNSNMNVLRNKKKSVTDYCQENWLLFKEQWVKCFKSQTYNMRNNKQHARTNIQKNEKCFLKVCKSS